MPLTYRIDADAGMLLVAGEGAINQSERLEAMRGWLGHPDFRPGLNTLCDFSAATSTPTMAELREMIALIDRNEKRIGKKKLEGVEKQPISYSVERQFQTLPV